MESSTNVNPNPSPAGEPESGSFPDDYWSGMGMLYPSDQPTPEQPFGIGWDHPVFQGGPPNSQQPQTQAQPQPQPQPQPPQQHQHQHQHQHRQDPYLHPQQGWQPPQQGSLQSPVMAAPEPQPQPQLQQGHQLPPHYHMSPFHQSPAQQQLPFDPAQSSHPQFHHYQFDNQHYYSNPPLPGQEGFPQPQPQQHQPLPQHQPHRHPSGDLPVNHSPALAPSSLERQHADLQPNIPPNAVQFPPIQDQHARSGYHHTINPQFLTAPQPQVPSPGQQQQPQQQTRPQPQQQGSFFMNLPDLDTRNYQYPGGVPTRQSTIPPQYLVPGQAQQANLQQTRNGIALAPKPAKPAAPRKKADTAIKAHKAQTKMAGSKAAIQPKPAATTEEPSSESESSDSSDDEEPEPSPLPAQRPGDVEGGMQYDTMKVVWSPRNKQPLVSEVRNSMVAFSDLVKGIRDTWKSRSEALKAAENQNQEDKILPLKRDLVLQRRLLELVVDTTLDKGHPAFYRRYGEHPIILSAFYSFLLDRHTAADSEGPLAVKILKVMAKFATMDQAMLEKTKNDKILVRFVKKGGDNLKQLAKTILDNANAVSKKKDGAKASSSKENSPAVSAASTATQDGIKSPPQPGVKRARETEGSDASATKRTVTPANGKPTTKPTAATVKKTAAPSNQNAKSAQNQSTAAKPKPNMVTPKPNPNLFSSLMSASKKPGTSNAARAAAAAKEKTSPEQKSSPPRPPVARPAFSFSETLADLGKPKEPAPAEPAEEKPPETEEERKKRLRKEERRKLRVTWKPDESLTEVRIFTHDPQEEIGHEDSMMRDVDDVAGEGRMLKMHRDFDDLDDEEEGLRDETFFPYTPPSAIEFDVLGKDQATNYTKTGGHQEPNSPEKRAQEQREATTLSAFHASPADVPISPKEPPEPEDEPYDPEAPFGEPDEKTKARSDKYFAAREPRAPPARNQAQQQQPAATSASGGVDIAGLLKMLQPNQQPQQPQPQPQQPPVAPQSNMSDLERTFNQFRNPQATPAAPMSQPPQATPTPGFEVQNLLALMNAQNQMQQPQTFQPPQPPTQPPNLASILAQFSNPGEQQQSQQQQGYGNQQSHFQEGPGKKRMRDGTGGYDGAEEAGSKHKKRFRVNGDPGKPKKHPKAGLVPCRYWKEGKCIKGDDCTFRHDPLE